MTEKTRVHVVYALSDPESGAIRYVGRTMYPKRRKREHSTLAGCKPRLPVGRWIKSLLSRGLKPVFSVIETLATFEECLAREMHWISFHKKESSLLNLTAGGDGTYGYAMSDATKEKIGLVHRGVTRSPEVRAALSAGRMGIRLSDSHKANIKAAMNRPDVRDKISAAVKATKTPELKLKVQIAMRGRVFSEAHRQNLSRALKGRVFSDKTRAIWSARRKGMKFSNGARIKV